MLSGCHGFSIDNAFKIHIFVLFVLFLFYFFKLFFYILYVYLFVPRYITTYICIPGDSKFFRLICRCLEKKFNYFKQRRLQFYWNGAPEEGRWSCMLS